MPKTSTEKWSACEKCYGRESFTLNQITISVTEKEAFANIVSIGLCKLTGK